MTIKALSYRQPWAWALVTEIVGSVSGDKIVENRTWGTAHRGPLLIVSSSKGGHLREYEMVESVTGLEIEELAGNCDLQYPVRFHDPYMQGGMILGVVNMVACLKLEEYEKGLTYARLHDVSICVTMQTIDHGRIDVSHLKRTKDMWAVGPYCHVYSNVRRLPPTRAMGRLGMYPIASVGGEAIEAFIEREGVIVR